MSVFRPAEIRIIVLLSALVLAGSILTMLKRQGRISSLDLGIFTDKGYYKYEYSIPASDTAAFVDTAGLKTPEANPRSPLFPININTAGYYDLQALPGVGPSIARSIIACRDTSGGFSSVDDLLKVNGIGPAKLEKIRDKVSFR